MMHSDREAELREEICAVGRRLYARGLIAGGDGNISARLADDMVLITPAGLCKGELTPDDLVVVDPHGLLLRAARGRRQSSEQLLHLHAYRRRADVTAIVHAHPPTAVALTLAGVGMAEPLLPEALLALGPVPTAPYARTGTAAMGEAIDALLPDHDAMLLSHHGALALADTPTAAFFMMEQIEHCARILHAARLLGPIRPLAPAQADELLELRRRIKARTYP